MSICIAIYSFFVVNIFSWKILPSFVFSEMSLFIYGYDMPKSVFLYTYSVGICWASWICGPRFKVTLENFLCNWITFIFNDFYWLIFELTNLFFPLVFILCNAYFFKYWSGFCFRMSLVSFLVSVSLLHCSFTQFAFEFLHLLWHIDCRPLSVLLCCPHVQEGRASASIDLLSSWLCHIFSVSLCV